MMGRGTRLCKSFPNGIGTAPKTHFTVFDCFAGTLLESFKNETSITQSAPLSPNRTIRQIIQELSDSVDVDYNTRCLVKRLQRINKNITQEGRDRLTKFIPDGDLGHFASSLPDQLDKELVETLKLLNNDELIDLLENYPRPPKQFIRAIESEDVGPSEYLFRP